jgi:hypothetical protein
VRRKPPPFDDDADRERAPPPTVTDLVPTLLGRLKALA